MKKSIWIIAGLVVLAGIWYYWKNIAVKSSSATASLLGRKVSAKYTGKSGTDLPIGAADMPQPLKNGQILQGTIMPEGLQIIVYGIGTIPQIIPYGQFEVISVLS